MATAGSWESLNPHLSQHVLAALAKGGFPTMTPVQASTVPLLLSNKDVVVKAATGSGKTLAFLVPLLELLAKNPERWTSHQLSAVVLSPTRELAGQITSVLRTLLDHLKTPIVEEFDSEKNKADETQEQKTHREELTALWSRLTIVEAVGGGGAGGAQLDLAKVMKSGANVLVGTPGRVSDILSGMKPPMRSSNLELLILDEADRLLDLGFRVHIDRVLATLPKQRRTGLFSATQTDDVASLVRSGLRNPFQVSIAVSASASKRSVPVSLTNSYVIVPAEGKLPALVRFLNAHPGSRVLVFFLTCATVDHFAPVLKHVISGKCGPTGGHAPHEVFALHGRLAQSKRNAVWKGFCKTLEEPRRPRGSVLLVTDVAARGLDAPNVDWVVQFDPPQQPDSFVHRVGRTARNGAKGSALTILMPSEADYPALLSVKGVPARPLTEPRSVASSDGPPSNQAICDAAAAFAATDHGIIDSGSKAYVSWNRGYREHAANHILKWSALDHAGLARTFGLLKMPHMPELAKRGGVPNWSPPSAAPADLSTVPYKNADKGAAAAARATKLAAKAAARAAGAGSAWSQKLTKKEKRSKRREIKEAALSIAEAEAVAGKKAGDGGRGDVLAAILQAERARLAASSGKKRPANGADASDDDRDGDDASDSDSDELNDDWKALKKSGGGGKSKRARKRQRRLGNA